MSTLIKNNFKLFFKSIYLIIGFLTFFIAVNAYLIMGIYKLAIHKDAFYYLGYSQEISIIYFIFFVFISYEYFVKSKNINLIECFSAVHKGKIKLYFSQSSVLIMLISAMTLTMMIYNYFVFMVMNVNAWSYAVHIFLVHLLNIFLVSFSGICIGMMVSLYLKRFPAYLAMISVTVLISPVCEFVPYILFMGFDINIYSLREMFNILPPNLNWTEDELYGLSIEPYRWNRLIFWISFFLFFILLKLKTKNFKFLNVMTMIFLVLSVINLYAYTNHGSIVIKDYNPKGYVAFDEFYYLNDMQKEENAEFKISAYDMELTIDRQLHNDIKITIDENKPLDSYPFTLYRNYDVEKILGKNNERLLFKRDGDYLEVFNPGHEKLEKIRVIYGGYSPVFYSNGQGVFLPGFFPYYPVEGFKKIYIKQESIFIPIIRDYNVEFKVSIRSGLDINSNLEKKGDHLSGKAQAVTLVGGFVEEKKIGNNILYGLILEKLDTDALADINHILEPYRSVLSENEKLNITGKKIFQIPDAFASRVMDNSTVCLEDHIFTYGLKKEMLICAALQSAMPQDMKKRGIKTAFLDYMVYKNRFHNRLEHGMNTELYRLFSDKINELGEKYVLQSTYDFLRNEKDTRDSTTFIHDLTAGGR